MLWKEAANSHPDISLGVRYAMFLSGDIEIGGYLM
jgi:hypothetical protein